MVKVEEGSIPAVRGRCCYVGGGPASSEAEAEADPDQEHESTCAAVISVVIIVMLILKETAFPAGGEESRRDR